MLRDFLPGDRLKASTSCVTVNDVSTNICFDHCEVYIEAVKQRNTSGDIYHYQRICALMCMCLYWKETLRFAFLVSMPKTLSATVNRYKTITKITEPRLSAHP